ncbi:hypothetical protein AAFF_G00079380 [Aldrovandia affinis]|uniref:Uncharacterized protein n=1 Tax=Aldrovandia affinis TaxID=143900 RepID=A0AAD7RXH3_9TELE|nr:hypothetical protein AAFF_G00079380 [Aldrovandia affinis]
MTFEHSLRFSLSLIPVLFFIYINCVMLVTLKSKPAFQGVSRYILFGHMLVADSFQLISSMLSYIIATVKMYMSNVGIIIIYTYFAIMVEAKSASSDKGKATKARNTVLLHLIQLGLSLTSFMVSESPDIRAER